MREDQKGLLLAILFVFILAFCVIFWLTNYNWVLGTELNTNGLVEYLCLGRGCEDINN